MTPLLIILGIVAVIALYFIAVYNGLIKQKNRVENGFSQIDVQLQRRYDLIPNLVETVKGYAAHEKETLEMVIKARNAGMNAGSVGEKADADNMMTGALKTLFALSEAYPDLKANQNFKELQLELTSTENKISFSRQFYNDTVASFNTAIQVFPKNIIAGMLGFKAFEFFKTDNAEARQRVDVKF